MLPCSVPFHDVGVVERMRHQNRTRIFFFGRMVLSILQKSPQMFRFWNVEPMSASRHYTSDGRALTMMTNETNTQDEK